MLNTLGSSHHCRSFFAAPETKEQAWISRLRLGQIFVIASGASYIATANILTESVGTVYRRSGRTVVGQNLLMTLSLGYPSFHFDTSLLDPYDYYSEIYAI